MESPYIEVENCDFDTTLYIDIPIGMFHCPKCGTMVIAGMEHGKTDYELWKEEMEKFNER